MSLIIFIYISFFVFLIGFFSLLYFKGMIRAAIGLQLIIFSALLNFLGFSYHLYVGSLWDKTFSILGLVVLYLLLFSIFFYGHSTLKKENLDSFNQLNFFEWDKSIWWGEDNS
ncbi:MAG: hypothetical protein ACQEP5_03830 [Actinomycetota bacterium]